ncbi:hypothetical protein B0H10DRAFT_2236943 [Mycena sp. CBHHK59/15]|nr:hypothetical protein B0H10DRAFT_2236943 [Mycena sp. CBHHK59/15]
MDQDAEPAGSNDALDDFDGLPDLKDANDFDSDSDSESGDEESIDLAGRWEPRVVDNEDFPGLREEPEMPDRAEDFEADPQVPAREDRDAAERQVHGSAIIVEFTDGDAGAPLRKGEPGYERYRKDIGDPDNIWAPFASKLEWELARWAKLRGPGSTAFTDLLKITGITELLGLSYKNTRELNNIIDKKLPGRPKFRRKEIIVAGEAYDVYFRDILECIKALYGDPEFAAHLKFAPERHYADKDETIRLYHDMHTGKWWWATQRELEKKRKGATIIPVIISSDKTLLTLFRNRTAYPVYLTIGNIPKDIRRKPSRQAQILLAYLPTSKLEHITNKSSRRRALANLFHACMSKIMEPLKTAGVDGITVVSGDGVARRGHPILAAYVGDYPEQVLVTCVKNMDCPECPETAKGLGASPVEGEPEFRDLGAVLDALAAFDDDPADHISRVTGQEHDQMCRFLLGIVIDIPLPDNLSNVRLIRSIRALLDFLYLAQYPIHSDETLAQLDDALNRFHDNKDIFVDLGIRTNFNLPKLHFLRHYKLLITRFGTTDNFNTEYTERLHIDLAKDAYRATNHKDEYPQMTQWLERKEKILLHAKFIQWRQLGQPSTPTVPPGIEYSRSLKMTKHPSQKFVSFNTLVQDYGATYFRDAIARYVVATNNPGFSAREVETYSSNLSMPFRAVPVYHKIKQKFSGAHVPARFDTVLVNDGDGKDTSVDGYRVGQVRVIFSIPEKSIEKIFKAGVNVPKYLVSVNKPRRVALSAQDA